MVCVPNTSRLVKAYWLYLGKWVSDFLLKVDQHFLDLWFVGGFRKARRVGLSCWSCEQSVHLVKSDGFHLLGLLNMQLFLIRMLLLVADSTLW